MAKRKPDDDDSADDTPARRRVPVNLRRAIGHRRAERRSLIIIPIVYTVGRIAILICTEPGTDIRRHLYSLHIGLISTVELRYVGDSVIKSTRL